MGFDQRPKEKEEDQNKFFFAEHKLIKTHGEKIVQIKHIIVTQF
jgi:hypothetical protein